MREQVPDAQLVLAGSMATDDPEGFRVWETTEAARGGDRDIHLLSNLHQVGAVQINAFQRIARRRGAEVVAGGLRPHREPRRCGRAGRWSADARAASSCRSATASTATSSTTSSRARSASSTCWPTPWVPTRWVSQGREHVRANFLSHARARGLAPTLRRVCGPDPPVLVVSNRGPYRFTAEADGDVHCRARRAVGSRAHCARCSSTATQDATWVAAALTDDDRAARGGRRRPRARPRPRAARPRPRARALHYDVVSNGTLWFLHHGMFDLVRRPRFDRHFHEAWAGYVEVNERFAGGRRRARGTEATSCWCRTISSHSRPASFAPRDRDLRVAHFTHTPFCGPNSIRVLPTTVAEQLIRAMATVPCGFHTNRWARAYARVGARDARRRHRAAADLHRVTRARPRRAARPWPTRRRRTRPRPSSTRWWATDVMILRIDRIDPSKNIVRGFAAYDRLLDAAPRVAGQRRVRRAAQRLARGPARVPRVPPRGRASGRRP